MSPKTQRRKARRKAEANGHDLERYHWVDRDYGFWEACCRRCVYVSLVGQLYPTDEIIHGINPLEAMTCEQIQQQYGSGE